ncbi:MAG: hypothetical protein ACW963_03710, partial [Candidatus Sifarchaeia archaeon]
NGLTEYYDKNPNDAYDEEDTIYRHIQLDDPNLLFGKDYDVSKQISANKIILTFRARGNILDTAGNEVGFADVSFVTKIYASNSSGLIFTPNDGVEMAFEVIVSDWEFHNKDVNVVALNTSLRMQAGDSATIDGNSLQNTNSYEKITPLSNIDNVHKLSVSNSSNAQIGYMRLASKDNQNTREHYSYKTSGTQITLISTYLNLGKSDIHQMSLGVPESSTDQEQGFGGFGGSGGITSILQGLPGIFSNILFIEVVVIVAVLVIIAVFLVRRVKRE